MNDQGNKQSDANELEGCRVLIEEMELTLNQLRLRLNRLARRQTQS